MKRRKIIGGIGVILAIILVGSVVHGIFFKDDTQSKSVDTTPVVENEEYKEIPKDDSTPEDYSPEENISICQNVMQNMSAWTSKTEGTAEASVLFINYTQDIFATKVVKDNDASVQTVSKSTLLSTGQQRYFKDGAIIIRNAKTVKSESDITWEDEFKGISEETYAEKYGKTPFAMTNYVITEDTIKEAKEIETDDDTYKFEYVLNPDTSTIYYKRQMKTEGGASDYPTFNSVKVTVTMDKNWRPLEIHYSENYDITISVVGSVTCQGEITETFADFEQVEELPDEKSVENYIKTKYDKNNLSELEDENSVDVSAYINDIFEKQPYYNIKLSSGKDSYNFKLYIDIKNGILKLKNDTLFAAYDGEKVYIHAGNIKVSCKAEGLLDAMTVIAKTMDSSGETIDFSQIKNINMDSLTSDDELLKDFMDNVSLEMDDSLINVNLNTEELSLKVTAQMDDEGNISLECAKLKVSLQDLALKIKITSGEKEEFDNLTGFEDITEALTLVEPWTKTITSEGIKTNISLKYGKTKISGVAVIGYNPFKLKLTTKIEGVKLTIKYIDDVVYLKSGKIAIRCKMSNLEKNISAILTMAGVDLKLDSTSVIPKAYTRLIDKLQGENTDINYLLKRVKSVKYNKGKLIVKANVGKDTVKLSLGKNTVAVSGVTLKGEKTSLKAKNIKNYTKSPKIKVKKSGYVKLANILKTLKGVQADKLLSAKEISFQTNIYAGNQVLKADVVLDYGTSAALSITTYLDEIKVNFIYREEKMYISAGNIQISCQTDEIDKAVSYILKLLGKTESTKDISFSDTIEKIFTGVEQIDINAKDIIDSITLFQYKKGSLNIGLKLSNTRFIIAIKKGIVRISIPDGLQKIEGCESLLNTLETFGVENVADNALSAKISNIKLSRKQSVKVSTKKYVPLMNIINVLDKSGIFNLLNSEGLEGDVTLRTGDTSITANIKLNYSDDIQAQISFMAGEGNNKTEIKIVYDNDMVYVSAGNIMLYSKVEELKSILQKALELADVSLDFDEESINRLTGFVNELTMKDVVNCISNLYCDSNTLKLTYKTEQSNIDVKIHNNSISVDGLKIEGKEIGIDFILNSTKKQKITVENKDKYINLSEIVELLTNNTGVCIDTSINGADLSLVYEKNEIYVNYDGLKIKADEGTAASVLNAIAKIYEIDLTDVFDVFGIKEDVQDINLNMFKQYADINDLTKLENSLSEGGNIGANITEILDMQMEPEGLRCSINLKNKVNVFIYNTDKHSEEPEDSGQYIDFASIDLLLKGFGKTAQNLNFDLSAKVKLGLNLGLIKFNLTDVPITAKIKVEQDGVYGNIHIDVPYMKNVTSNNFDLPEETTETVSDSSKTKTEYKTTYSLKSDTQEITSDLYIMPEYIYTHKKVAYSYEKTVTATSYKKIGIIWLPQSVTKNTEIVPVEQDYYSKSSYSQYSGAILENLGFTLNLTDDIVTMINDSATNNDISGTKISDIFQSYSYNSQKNQYTFGLDLSGITDGALGDTTVGITENEQGYLDKLDIDSSIYSILSLTMEGELNNIGQYVDIGFEPEKFPFSLYVND